MTKPEHIAYQVALNGVRLELEQAIAQYEKALEYCPPGNGHRNVLHQQGVMLANMRTKVNGFLGEVESGVLTTVDPRVRVASDG